MGEAKYGDTVRVHYRAKLHDGSVFDENFNRGPLRFTIGGGQLIPGFEEAVVGMKPGDAKKTELPAEKAFGSYQEDMVIVVPRSLFSEWELEPVAGERVSIPLTDGPPIDVTVAKVTESAVTVDANHPLAGKHLSFDIELIDIVHGAH